VELWIWYGDMMYPHPVSIVQLFFSPSLMQRRRVHYRIRYRGRRLAGRHLVRSPVRFWHIIRLHHASVLWNEGTSSER
jgi:hypothetical protein